MTMVLAMVPAVSVAATDGGTSAQNPIVMYVGDVKKADSAIVSFTCLTHSSKKPTTTCTLVDTDGNELSSKGGYVSYSGGYITAEKTTLSTAKDGSVGENIAKFTIKCATSGCTTTPVTRYFKVYSKGESIALKNADTDDVLKDTDTLIVQEGVDVILDYSVLTSTKSTTFTTSSTANQSLVEVSKPVGTTAVTAELVSTSQQIKVSASTGSDGYEGYFNITFDKGTTHEKTRKVKLAVVNGPVVTIKNGNSVVVRTGEEKTITASIDDVLNLTATAEPASNAITWQVTQSSIVVRAQGDGKYKVVGTGEATISACLNGKSAASFTVRVLDTINSITIEGSADSDTALIDDEEMALTDTLTLHAKVRPSASQDDAAHAVWSITSGDTRVEFDESQSKPALWTIDEDENTATGEYVRLKAKKAGTFTVKVELGGKSDELTMTINAATKKVMVTAITDKELAVTVRNGSNQDILDQMNSSTSAYRYVDATAADGPIHVPVEWRTVDKGTNNTAKIYGIVLNEDDNGTIYDYSGVSGSLQVKAKATLSDEAAITNIEITSDKDLAIADDRVTLTASATVAPSNATLKYQWYVNGSAIKDATKKTLTYTIPKASTDSSTSYKFTCEVTASYKGDSTSKTSKAYTVTVSRDYAVSVSTSTGKTSFTVGDKPELEATLTYKNSKVTNPSVSWKLYDENENSIDSAVAIISGSGSTATVTTKAVKNAKGDKIVVRATVSANGQSFSSSETLTIKPAEAAKVTQSVGSGAALKSSSITSAITKAAGSSAKISYLVFDTPKNCTLQKSSSSSSSIGDTKCYVSTTSGQKLSDVYVKTSSTSASVTYTAYDADDYVLATGTISFDANDAGDTITASGASFKTIGAADQILGEYSDADYVKFDLPKASEGKLYYDYTTISDFDSEVKDSDKYYLNASSSQNDVEDVYLLPAAGVTGKFTVSYTAYSSSNSDLGSGKITVTIKTKNASDTFTDVTSKTGFSWAADSIDFGADNGIIKGATTYTYAPSKSLTRAQLVTILYRAAGSPSVTGVTNPFKDTKSDYYTNAMLWAYKNGIVTGTSNTTFSPDAPVTREQIATILYRYMGSPTATGSLTGYTDRASVSSFATTAMQWAIGKGYITGIGTKLDPKGNATRAQVAVIIHRFLTK